MAQSHPDVHHKKRRRRRQDKVALNARLVLDDHVKGDVGIVSEDVFRDLFPHALSDATESNNHILPEHYYIAIAPKAPLTSIDDVAWTVVPVRLSSALASTTIQFSPSSIALQAFAEELHRISPSKLLHHSRSGIEILALDVSPLALDTVFVSVEADLAKRLESGEVFYKERPNSNGNTKSSDITPTVRLESGIREALSSLQIIHSGDYFALPLTPHPVTHAPAAPARVTLCEPVAQGILLPSTRIIVTKTHRNTQHSKKNQASKINRALHHVMEADEDTANEAFYSAAEDRERTDVFSETDDAITDTENENEISDLDHDDLSDDSMEDMISLQAPILSATGPSGASTMQPGTPMTLGYGRKTGINTPGSVFSSYTATTARAGGQRGRLFKAQCLMQPIPPQILRPQPTKEDDEENRIYVDLNSLTKIGCFSGDWARLETADTPPANGMGGLYSLASFGQEQDDDFQWRAVKVYSLPEGYSHRSVTKIANGKEAARRTSFFDSHIQEPANPTAYFSPVLWANLDETPYIRLSGLKRNVQYGRLPQNKITGGSRPPVAQEVTLTKIYSPLSSERALDMVQLAALKRHFSQKVRMLKIGDLIALPIDEKLGRILSTTSDEFSSDTALNKSTSRPSNPSGAVWFKVDHIVPGAKNDTDIEEEDVWGGVATIDVSVSNLRQSGSARCRVLATIHNSWEYYLGLCKTPRTISDSAATTLGNQQVDNASTLQRRLRQLIAAATSPRALHLNLQPLAILLISTQRSIGKATVATRACANLGLHTFTIDGYEILSEGSGGGDVKTEGFLTSRAERAMNCGAANCALLIRHAEALTADRMALAFKEILTQVRVLIATTTEVDKIPDGVRGLFTHEIEMSAPDEGERKAILGSIISDRGVTLASDVDLSGVAVKTAALVAGDLVDVVDRALVAQRVRLEAIVRKPALSDLPITMRDVQICGGHSGASLTKADFDYAVEAARKNFADSIGAPKIPNVGWDDVGGLSNVKDAVMETIQLPLERPELFAKGMKKRSGILFYGPPGTGKTLLAKAIATEFSLNFFSVKGPELLNMYIGESEANVRRVFQRARDARPCVVFFDELDSVAPKRGNQGDSGGVMDRIVSQLLAELDGMSDGEDGGGGVFVIGATNRPDLLDAALLRPGRFDKMLYLGVSDTHEKQATIMEALTRKFTMAPNLSLPSVAAHLPFTYTGADFYALCSDAMLKAVTRQASAVDAKIAKHNSTLSPDDICMTPAYFFDHHATKEDIAVMVTEEDFLAANKELIPSVSAKELEHYKKVREQFENVEETSSEAANADEKGKGKGRLVLNGNGSNGVEMDSRTNGKSSRSKGKGKGKAKATLEDIADESDEEMNVRRPSAGYGDGGNGFQEGRVEDEEDLY